MFYLFLICLSYKIMKTNVFKNVVVYIAPFTSLKKQIIEYIKNIYTFLTNNKVKATETTTDVESNVTAAQ